LIGLIITLVVVGLLLWVVETFIPMDAKVKLLLQVVVILILVLYALSFFGVISGVREPIRLR
jgi:hypothetical protein